MFTGIIAGIGKVDQVDQSPRGHGGGALAHRLTIDLQDLVEGLIHGASVAINGVCLTAAVIHGSSVGFDVVPETWKRSTLGELRPGQSVNVERSLRAGDPLDGHFVQGHVDGIGVVERIDRSAGQWKLWVEADTALFPAIVPKGSISLDGTSLTIVDVDAPRFSVAIVPTTLECTTLGQRRSGDRLNIETDILARLVLQRIGAWAGESTAGGITWDKLSESGFA